MHKLSSEFILITFAFVTIWFQTSQGFEEKRAIGICDGSLIETQLLKLGYDTLNLTLQLPETPEPNSELMFCSSYSSSTCCTKSITYALKVASSEGRKYGDKCFEAIQSILCKLCDPEVGVGNVAFRLCKSSCDSLWKNCASSRYVKYEYKDISGQYPSLLEWIAGSDGTKGTSYFGREEYFEAASLKPIATNCGDFYDDNNSNDDLPCFNI